MAEVRKFNYLCKAVHLFVGYEEDFRSKKKKSLEEFCRLPKERKQKVVHEEETNGK